eukprot:TRINITY_DN4983_c0_g2_i2.p2 TRINITY_DN4983_c0_g2~~TRINITY_DN4983_c0_g2_i2.p2  ORF type:complete len:359 (-),score=99.89 TRINITY_DN4983_c0_g2_i2:648-1724(-)
MCIRDRVSTQSTGSSSNTIDSSMPAASYHKVSPEDNPENPGQTEGFGGGYGLGHVHAAPTVVEQATELYERHSIWVHAALVGMLLFLGCFFLWPAPAPDVYDPNSIDARVRGMPTPPPAWGGSPEPPAAAAPMRTSYPSRPAYPAQNDDDSDDDEASMAQVAPVSDPSPSTTPEETFRPPASQTPFQAEAPADESSDEEDMTQVAPSAELPASSTPEGSDATPEVVPITQTEPDFSKDLNALADPATAVKRLRIMSSVELMSIQGPNADLIEQYLEERRKRVTEGVEALRELVSTKEMDQVTLHVSMMSKGERADMRAYLSDTLNKLPESVPAKMKTRLAAQTHQLLGALDARDAVPL